MTQPKAKTPKEPKAKKEKAVTIALTTVEKGAKVAYIPIDKLIGQEIAPREELRAIAKLKRSIKKVGILEPLIVRQHPEQEGKYEVISGSRRLEALKQLEIQTAPCLTRPCEAKAVLSHVFVSNTQRVNLSRFDTNFIATALVEAVGKDEAATLLAVTPKALDRLLEAPTQREAVAEGEAKEVVLMLDAEQTLAFITGDDTKATFAKPLAKVGDTATLVGVLGKAIVSEVKEVEGGYQITWELQ